MSYAERPWLARYLPGMPSDIDTPYPSALAMFRATVERAGELPGRLDEHAALGHRRVEHRVDPVEVEELRGVVHEVDRVVDGRG